jgi:hypothetical protein
MTYVVQQRRHNQVRRATVALRQTGTLQRMLKLGHSGQSILVRAFFFVNLDQWRKRQGDCHKNEIYKVNNVLRIIYIFNII